MLRIGEDYWSACIPSGDEVYQIDGPLAIVRQEIDIYLGLATHWRRTSSYERDRTTDRRRLLPWTQNTRRLADILHTLRLLQACVDARAT